MGVDVTLGGQAPNLHDSHYEAGWKPALPVSRLFREPDSLMI